MRASLFFDEFLFPLDCFRNETQVITYLKVISSPIQIILQAIALIARNPFYRIYPMSIPVYFVNNSYQVQLLKQVLIFFLFWLLWNGNPFLSFEFSHNIEMKLQIAPLNTSELRCLPPRFQNLMVIFLHLQVFSFDGSTTVSEFNTNINEVHYQLRMFLEG